MASEGIDDFGRRVEFRRACERGAVGPSLVVEGNGKSHARDRLARRDAVCVARDTKRRAFKIDDAFTVRFDASQSLTEGSDRQWRVFTYRHTSGRKQHDRATSASQLHS